MIYNRFKLNIIFRVILIAGTSLLMTWLFQTRGISLTFLVLIVIFVLETLSLLNYVNKTNQLLTFFFDAVKNEDSTLVFDEIRKNVT